MIHKRFARLIIRRRRRLIREQQYFHALPCVPACHLYFFGNLHIVLHIMGILMLKQIYAIFFGQRILHTICNKQQRK